MMPPRLRHLPAPARKEARATGERTHCRCTEKLRLAHSLRLNPSSWGGRAARNERRAGAVLIVVSVGAVAADGVAAAGAGLRAPAGTVPAPVRGPRVSAGTGVSIAARAITARRWVASRYLTTYSQVSLAVLRVCTGATGKRPSHHPHGDSAERPACCTLDERSPR